MNEEELTVTIPLTPEQVELLKDPAAIEYLRAKLEEAYTGAVRASRHPLTLRNRVQ